MSGAPTPWRGNPGHYNREHPAGWIEGIDVSIYQAGKVDYARAKAEARISFCYGRATSGAYYKDAAYKAHKEAAKGAGVHFGAYHYFVNSHDPKAQAVAFCDVMGDTFDLLPPALDIEDPYFDYKNPPPPGEIGKRSRNIEERALRCAEEIERITKKRVLIYTGAYFFNHATRGLAKDRFLWLPAYPGSISEHSRPRLPSAFDRCLIWQWAGNDGRVLGVDGPCDRNYFMGSASDWASWLKASDLGEATKEVLPEPGGDPAGLLLELEIERLKNERG